MLVMTRAQGEIICVDGPAEFHLLGAGKLRGEQRIGIEAPKTTRIWRKELERVAEPPPMDDPRDGKW